MGLLFLMILVRWQRYASKQSVRWLTYNRDE
jgi:hypothetical protein